MEYHRFTVSGRNESKLKPSKVVKYNTLAELRKWEAGKPTKVDAHTLLSAAARMLLAKQSA